MEFIDIISLWNGKYIKRYWKDVGGKKEIIEIESEKTAYTEYLEKKAMKLFRESGYGDKPWNYDVINQHAEQVDRFNFNQQSNFLYHFVNKFTDTEISIEAIREELENLTTNDNNSHCGCKPEQCKMIQGKCKNLAYR